MISMEVANTASGNSTSVSSVKLVCTALWGALKHDNLTLSCALQQYVCTAGQALIVGWTEQSNLIITSPSFSVRNDHLSQIRINIFLCWNAWRSHTLNLNIKLRNCIVAWHKEQLHRCGNFLLFADSLDVCNSEIKAGKTLFC